MYFQKCENNISMSLARVLNQPFKSSPDSSFPPIPDIPSYDWQINSGSLKYYTSHHPTFSTGHLSHITTNTRKPARGFQRATVTYRVCVSVGRPDAAGAWSSPMLEQLTTHKFWGPTAVHEQFPGHGLHAPPSAVTPERASRQQSAKSRLENNPNFGRQTPCFRLNTICPFLQGIAHSHLIAPSVGEVFLGTRGGKFTLFPVFP